MKNKISLIAFIGCIILVVLAGVAYGVDFSVKDVIEVYNTGSYGLVVRGPDACGGQIGGKFDGDRGVVLSGPFFCNSYYRWKIRWSDGLEGWSAQDWLRKVQISPSTKFKIGDRIKVNANSVRVRDKVPELNYIDIVNTGDQGTVVDGPFYGVPNGSSGFYYFWKIDYDTKTDGWTAENYLDKLIMAPSVETREASNIGTTSAILNARIISNGGADINERRFSWGTTSSCSDGWTNNVNVSGDYFSYYLTGLKPGTKYYFQSWAHNSVGWGVGNVISFTTLQESCSCTSWQNKGCGEGGCPSTNRLQTRTCTPSGCEAESQCVSDSSCQSCTPNSKRCNGNVVETCKSDGSGWTITQNCGKTSYCSAGSCISCSLQTANCNENPLDSCEVNLNNDNNNCGSCGNVCSSGQTCQNGVCKSGGSQINGIDVSSHQGTINWSSVYNAGYKFAFVKATQRDSFNDSNFITNINNAKAAGLLVGAYHFACPSYNPSQYCYGTSAEAEAQHFLNVAGSYLTQGYLRPVLDIDQSICNDFYNNKNCADLRNWIDKWMGIIKTQKNVTPILYTGPYCIKNCLESSFAKKYDLWVASHGSSPCPSSLSCDWDWTFWQYAIGSVNGINGSVDLDLFNGDMSKLNTFLINVSDNLPGGEWLNPISASEYRGTSCSLSNILFADGKLSNLARKISDSATYINEQSVSSCIKLDFGKVYNISKIAVRLKTSKYSCGDYCYGNYCNQGVEAKIFYSKDGFIWKYAFSVPPYQDLSWIEKRVSGKARYVLVCRDSSSHEALNLGVDNIQIYKT